MNRKPRFSQTIIVNIYFGSFISEENQTKQPRGSVNISITQVSAFPLFTRQKEAEFAVKTLQSYHGIVLLDLVRQWLPEASSSCVSANMAARRNSSESYTIISNVAVLLATCKYSISTANDLVPLGPRRPKWCQRWPDEQEPLGLRPKPALLSAAGTRLFTAHSGWKLVGSLSRCTFALSARRPCPHWPVTLSRSVLMGRVDH